MQSSSPVIQHTPSHLHQLLVTAKGVNEGDDKVVWVLNMHDERKRPEQLPLISDHCVLGIGVLLSHMEGFQNVRPRTFPWGKMMTE